MKFKFKLKKRLSIILLILAAGLCVFTLMDTSVVEADSGWDSSYGGSSGGWGSSDYNSWGSSDYSSSSSYSYGDWNYSNNYGNSKFNNLINIGLSIVIIVAFILMRLARNSRNRYRITPQENINNNYNSDDAASSRKLAEIGIDVLRLKEELFNKFVEVQEAWMNFDYDKLRQLCSDELYNQYKTDLEALKLTYGKNIMADFQKKNLIITDVLITKTTIKVELKLRVSFKDYVINTKTGEVTKGSKINRVRNEYNLVFVKLINNIKKCPSCGASLNNQVKCEYCGCVVPNNNNDFVLVDKKISK